MSSSIEVADIFRLFGPAYHAAYARVTSFEQRRAMHAIEVCRTAALGGHVEACDQCGVQRIAYNSCRNRHCPKCQTLDKERWLEARQQDVLPISYFHMVFTLPEALGPLAIRNQAVVYPLLFKAASETLLELSQDPKYLGAQIGLTVVLHTWSQTLMYHPHLHCMVTGGGLSSDGQQWIRSRKKYFLPVKVLSRLFRGKLLAYVKKAYQADALLFCGSTASWRTPAVFQQQLQDLYKKAWVVYCKPPVGRPQQVWAYLARYTHRVALSNERLVRLEGDQVTFRYRDSKDGNRRKTMTLAGVEFIRRFLLHVLPDRFVKIRHYGLLSNRHRKIKMALAKILLGVRPVAQTSAVMRTPWRALLQRLTGIDPTACPHCSTGRMVTRLRLLPGRSRSPPVAPVGVRA